MNAQTIIARLFCSLLMNRTLSTPVYFMGQVTVESVGCRIGLYSIVVTNGWLDSKAATHH